MRVIDEGYRGEMERNAAKIYGYWGMLIYCWYGSDTTAFKPYYQNVNNPKGPHLRRQHLRLPGTMNLPGRGRSAGHGALQIAGEGVRKEVFRAAQGGALEEQQENTQPAARLGIAAGRLKLADASARSRSCRSRFRTM